MNDFKTEFRWFEGNMADRFVQLVFYAMAAAVVGMFFTWIISR